MAYVPVRMLESKNNGHRKKSLAYLESGLLEKPECKEALLECGGFYWDLKSY